MPLAEIQQASSDVIQLSTITASIIGAMVMVLLGIISFFLSRILQQFDHLQQEFTALNVTLARIDKDLGGDVRVLTSQVQDLNPLFDRVRELEKTLISIQSGGCELAHRCALTDTARVRQ